MIFESPTSDRIEAEAPSCTAQRPYQSMAMDKSSMDGLFNHLDDLDDLDVQFITKLPALTSKWINAHNM